MQEFKAKVVQYLRNQDKTREEFVRFSTYYKPKYDKMIRLGYWFGAEVLRNGNLLVYIENEHKEVSSRIVEQGTKTILTLQELLIKFDEEAPLLENKQI